MCRAVTARAPLALRRRARPRCPRSRRRSCAAAAVRRDALGRLDQRAPAQVVAAERRAGRGPRSRRLLVDLAAERRALVDERDLEAAPGGLGGGGEPGGPAADDEEVVRSIAGHRAAAHAAARSRASLAGGHRRERRALGLLVDRRQLAVLLDVAEELVQVLTSAVLPFWTAYEPYCTFSGFLNPTCLSLLPFDLLNCASR